MLIGNEKIKDDFNDMVTQIVSRYAHVGSRCLSNEDPPRFDFRNSICQTQTTLATTLASTTTTTDYRKYTTATPSTKADSTITRPTTIASTTNETVTTVTKHDLSTAWKSTQSPHNFSSTPSGGKVLSRPPHSIREAKSVKSLVMKQYSHSCLSFLGNLLCNHSKE